MKNKQFFIETCTTEKMYRQIAHCIYRLVVSYNADLKGEALLAEVAGMFINEYSVDSVRGDEGGLFQLETLCHPDYYLLYYFHLWQTFHIVSHFAISSQ